MKRTYRVHGYAGEYANHDHEATDRLPVLTFGDGITPATFPSRNQATTFLSGWAAGLNDAGQDHHHGVVVCPEGVKGLRDEAPTFGECFEECYET